MEAQNVCLDTTFLIDLLRDLPEAVEKARELREASTDLSTTSINAFELYLGTLRSGNPKRLASSEALLKGLRILTLAKEEAEEGASILVDLMKRGKSIDMRDALMAGCMFRNGYRTSLTRDVEDFSRIPKIQVSVY